MIHGLSQNTDKVTDKCVVNTIIKDMKTEISVILIDLTAWVYREKKKIKHNLQLFSFLGVMYSTEIAKKTFEGYSVLGLIQAKIEVGHQVWDL